MDILRLDTATRPAYLFILQIWQPGGARVPAQIRFHFYWIDTDAVDTGEFDLLGGSSVADRESRLCPTIDPRFAFLFLFIKVYKLDLISLGYHIHGSASRRKEPTYPTRSEEQAWSGIWTYIREVDYRENRGFRN